MEYLIIQILSALAIALIAVWFDRKLRDKRELDSLMDSIVFELTGNLRIAMPLQTFSYQRSRAKTTIVGRKPYTRETVTVTLRILGRDNLNRNLGVQIKRGCRGCFAM